MNLFGQIQFGSICRNCEAIDAKGKFSWKCTFWFPPDLNLFNSYPTHLLNFLNMFIYPFNFLLFLLYQSTRQLCNLPSPNQVKPMINFIDELFIDSLHLVQLSIPVLDTYWRRRLLRNQLFAGSGWQNY